MTQVRPQSQCNALKGRLKGGGIASNRKRTEMVGRLFLDDDLQKTQCHRVMGRKKDIVGGRRRKTPCSFFVSFTMCPESKMRRGKKGKEGDERN